MPVNLSMEPMLDMFIFETLQLINQLEQSILVSEKSKNLNLSSVNEIFRIMHTIKGSAALMLFDNIAEVAHAVEDVFYFIREYKPGVLDFSTLSDIVLESIDYIKSEVARIESGKAPEGNSSELLGIIGQHLEVLKDSNPISQNNLYSDDTDQIQSKSIDRTDDQYYISSSSLLTMTNKIRYKAVMFFEEGCEMENIRAFSVIHNLQGVACDIEHIPSDILNNNESSEFIKREGFKVSFYTDLDYGRVKALFEETIFLKELKLDVVGDGDSYNESIKDYSQESFNNPNQENSDELLEKKVDSLLSKQNFISVNVSKMDKLMDLVGELVISEAMVTQNPYLKELKIEGFDKAARQLRKITGELQDIVMSVRMVPLSMTFQKMNRIVRDMNKKLNKNVRLGIIGEKTEVDKNIIEHISDPLLHLIRNSIDHGIEPIEERVKAGKTEQGNITLEAKSSGGDVWIIIKDDGKGLDKEKILLKARKSGLINKPENELTRREIHSFILLPGFSTKDNVTEFSGRGVGMDVVAKNVESIGGSIQVDSEAGKGTTVSIRIPLTLAIIDGMIIRVGRSSYVIPTTYIRESFNIKKDSVIEDIGGNEMIMIRDKCVPVLRLQKLYNVKTGITSIDKGIFILVENDRKSTCIFADSLIGQQQVVVKAFPTYIKKIKGITGCTLLGDGSISLILDIAGLLS